MTLNVAIALYFIFFSPNSLALQADYVTVVEDRPIMSVKYCLPVPSLPLLVKTNAPCRAVGFSAIHELLVYFETTRDHSFKMCFFFVCS